MLTDNTAVQTATQKAIGKGWTFPPTFSGGGTNVHTVSGTASIEQSLKILLSTNHHERVRRDNYGAELRRFMFEEISYTLLHELQTLVENLIARYELRIKVDEVDVAVSEDQKGLILIHIHYTILATYTQGSMVYPFYTQENTNE